MGESALRETGRYLVDHWYFVPAVVIVVVLAAIAYYWIKEKLGA